MTYYVIMTLNDVVSNALQDIMADSLHIGMAYILAAYILKHWALSNENGWSAYIARMIARRTC